MNTLITEARASKIWFDEYNIWVEFTDGRQMSVPLQYFPRLQKATLAQRMNYETSGDGTGIHWDALDEDISVQGLLNGVGDLTKKKE